MAIFYFVFILKNSFSEYRIMVDNFCFDLVLAFITLNMSFHCILTSIVSDSKSTVGFIFGVLYIKSIFSLPLAMNSLGTVCLMDLTWNFLRFFVLEAILFIGFGKCLSTYLSQFFSGSSLSSFILGLH